MIRLQIAALAALLGHMSTPASEAPIEYTVAPRVGPQGLERLDVTLRLRGDADGETVLLLPSRWAGTDALHHAIEGLAVGGGAVTETQNPARRVIHHAPGALLDVSYRIGLSAADPGPDYEKARPLLRPDWFYVHGEGAFAIPEGRSEAPARLNWAERPAGWQLASSTEGVAGALTANGVAESILLGGADLRILERSAGSGTMRLALRGDWPFSDRALADAIAQIIAAQDTYFCADARPFLVTMIPLTGAETGTISYGGTGRRGGFALASTTNVGLDQLLPTLAHEYGHNWFGGSLGPVPDPDAPEYWFTEGFGDYVSGQVLVRAGLWDAAHYRDHLNMVLLRYASSPARRLANRELAERFWTDPDVMQMPYDRGHLFALTLDRGGAVSAALRRMSTRPEQFAPGETQAVRFARAFGLDPDARDAMLAGRPIELPADLLAQCGTILWAEQPVFDRGFTLATSPSGRTIERVEPGHPAWAAGLRPGMQYVHRVSFRPNDSRVPFAVRIADGHGERVLSWLPEGREMVRFQRLILAPDAGEACRVRLAGELGRP